MEFNLETQKKQIEWNFTYHAPKPEQVEKYNELRNAAKALALLIAESTPYCREQSLALTHLEDVVSCANSAIARNPCKQAPIVEQSRCVADANTTTSGSYHEALMHNARLDLPPGA